LFSLRFVLNFSIVLIFCAFGIGIPLLITESLNLLELEKQRETGSGLGECVFLWPTDKQWRDVYAAENGERHLYI
jgi:hypothetical protein